VSLFIRLISFWNTPQNAGNSLTELQEIQKFSGGWVQIDSSVFKSVQVSSIFFRFVQKVKKIIIVLP
jgi:hypothetical protein